MPGRSSSSPPSAPCSSRPWTRVPVRVEPAGWTTSPAGLSTTSRCSSSQTIGMSIASACERRRARDARRDLLPALQPVALRRVARRRRAPPRRRSAARRALASRAPAARRGRGRAGRRPAWSGTRKRSGANAGARPVGRDERGEEQPDADDDEGVGEVERRPVGEVEEVGDMAEPDTIDQVRDAAADNEPERDREQRVALGRPRRRTRAWRRPRSP